MVAQPTYNDVIRPVANGEDVSAAITNRPITQLDNNVRYVLSLLEQFEAGSTIVARDQLIESAALTGMPVYFNATTNRFERALGTLELDSLTGAFITGPSTQVLGIVKSRANAATGDVLLSGMADIDMDAAIDGVITPGNYYLSNQVAGRLVKQRQPAGVFVAQVAGINTDGTRRVFVNIKFLDLLEAHKHYDFDLEAVPAGTHTPPDDGDPHVITDPDTGIEGWLPANHASFDGNAPLGAMFGYNIQAAAWKNLWPPVPADRAYLEWSKGGDGSSLGQGVSPQLCIIDRFGIWWMTNCYDRVPWPTDLDTATSLSESESESGCPLTLDPTLRLWFTRPVFNNTSTWVSSLQAAADSGLVIRCVDNGDPASTGHLEIDLNLSLTVDATPVLGHIVLKQLTDNKFKAGPVISSITPVGSNVSVTSNVEIGPNGQRYGDVQIAVDQDLEAGEISVDLVRMNGAEEENFQGVLGIGLVHSRQSGFRGRVTIPTTISLPTGTKMKLVFWVLNRANSDLPAEIFSMSYRRIANPGSTPTALPLLAAEVELPSIPAANIDVSAANQYFAIECTPFLVAAGDQVLFDFIRHGEDDGFNADLHILRQFGKYVRTS